MRLVVTNDVVRAASFLETAAGVIVIADRAAWPEGALDETSAGSVSVAVGEGA